MRVLFLLLFVLLIACTPKSEITEELVDRKLPLTRFFKLDGSIVSSRSYLGKPTVVVFWGEWCSHCRKTLPRFNELASQPEYRGRVNFLAVSVSPENEFEQFEKFISEEKITNLEQFFSGNYTADEAYVAWRGEDLPHFYVISSTGVLVLQSHSFSEVRSLLRDELL